MIREAARAWRRWAAHHRVRATMLFALVYIAISSPSRSTFLLGAALVATGQALRFWAAGHLERNVALARGGPYALVRHPLYLGSLLMGLGLALGVKGAAAWLLAFVALYLGFYLPAMHVEELRLQSLFGAEYSEYIVEVPRFVPRLLPVPRPEGAAARSFSLQRAVANLELRSAQAMAGLLLLQAIKLWIG